MFSVFDPVPWGRGRTDRIGLSLAVPVRAIWPGQSILNRGFDEQDIVWKHEAI